MCKLQEKITFKELEENLRRQLRRQWLHLTGCRRNTIAPPIHKSWWGHQTRSWHRSGPPPTDDQLVPLLPEPDPPPLLPSLDNYTNKSVIITGQEGYWHVGPEDEASVEDLETSTASSVLEEEEVTRAEVYACDSDLDQQEEDFVSTEMARIMMLSLTRSMRTTTLWSVGSLPAIKTRWRTPTLLSSRHSMLLMRRVQTISTTEMMLKMTEETKSDSTTHLALGWSSSPGQSAS